MSADDALGNQFWLSKAAATKFKLEYEMQALEEMQEREQMFMTFLQKERENSRLLEAQLEDTKRQLAAAPAAPALASADSLAALAPAAAADEVAGLKAELQAMREKVAEVEMKREVEVQQVAAFWLAKLAKAGEKAAGAAAPAAPPPPAEPMIMRTDLDSVAQERIAALENEVDTLEADYDAITDRLEVQAETIMLANTRLDEVVAALEAQAAKAEEQLQRSAAFWIERNAVLKAEAKSLREALEAASTPASGKGKKPKQGAKANAAEEDAQLRAQLDEAVRSLDAEKMRGERALQQTSAYWIGRLKSAKADVAASKAEASAQKSLAELRLAESGEAKADKLRELHAEELAVAAMRAERELQATSAFWIARLQTAKAAAKK